MIAYIEGYVLHVDGGWMTVSTSSGVGYDIKYGPSLNPVVGQAIAAYTEHAFSQDAQRLLGFACPQERTLAREVAKTDGVGPSSAHAVVTTIGTVKLLKMVRGVIPCTEVKVRGVSAAKMAEIILKLKKADLGDTEAATGDPRIVTARSTLTLLGHKGDEVEVLLALTARDHPSQPAKFLVSTVLQGIKA